MNFFRILVLPFGYLAYEALSREAESPKFRSNAILRGCLGFVPALLIFLVIDGFSPMDYSSYLLLLGISIRDTALWSMLACGTYALFYRFGDAAVGDGKRDLLAYICAFFCLANVYEFIAGGIPASIYSLFMLPALRAAIALSLSAFVHRASEGNRLKAACFVLAGIAFLGAAGFVGFFWLRYQYLYSCLCFAVLSAGAWLAHKAI
jgi:hypothetical protein